jgi:hypothetical protein
MKSTSQPKPFMNTSLNNREQAVGTIISFFALHLLIDYIFMMLIGLANQRFLLSIFGIGLFSLAGVCIFTFRKYRKENQPEMIDYLNISTHRYILGLFMILSGTPKLLGNFFDYQLFALDSKMTDVSEFQLAWYYFGKGKWMELFSGIMEFVPGALLLNRRTYYIASLIMLPVVCQVFFLNSVFEMGGFTFPAATVLLVCNLYIVFSQKDKIIQFFKSLDFTSIKKLQGKTLLIIKIARYTGIVLAILIIVRQISPVLFRSFYQEKYQKLVGVYTLDEMKKNYLRYYPTNERDYYKDLYIEKQEQWNMLRSFSSETNAFVLKINARNDSIAIYINRAGAGDDPAVIDKATALKGTYVLYNDVLTIYGVQSGDTLQLKYKLRGPLPKKWFW